MKNWLTKALKITYSSPGSTGIRNRMGPGGGAGDGSNVSKVYPATSSMFLDDVPVLNKRKKRKNRKKRNVYKKK